MDDIIGKYLDGVSTKEEEKLLYSWLKEDEKNLKFFKERILSEGLKDVENIEFDSMAAFSLFKKKMTQRVAKLPAIPITYYLKYAAVIAILVSSSFLIVRNIGGDESQKDQYKKIVESVKTEELQKVTVKNSDGVVKVVGNSEEELSYFSAKSEETKVTNNQITVPRGKIFRIVLSDSTVVWLNADTKLTYPSKFFDDSDTRSVVLEGEAFFDVSHDKNRPFVVISDNMEVKVLGTKFNVSSYPNEEQINTTLVEGSVQVDNIENKGSSIIIEPSFQASFDKNKLTLVSKKVDTYNHTAWMEKMIIFHDTPFEVLLDKIERTYNIDIVNENVDLISERFTGQFDVENINVIFEALSTSIYFEYEIEKNKVTILKP